MMPMCESTKGMVRVPAPTTVSWAMVVSDGASRQRDGVKRDRTGVEEIDDAANARGLARVAGIFTAASSVSTIARNVIR